MIKKKMMMKEMTAALCTAAMLFAAVPALPPVPVQAAEKTADDMAVSQSKSSKTRMGAVADNCLNQIFELFHKEGSDYANYKEANKENLSFTEELSGNTITVSCTALDDDYAYSAGEWKFVLEGDYIVFHYGKESFTGYALFSYIEEAVIEYLGMDQEMVNGYLQAVGTDKDNPYYQVTEDEGTGELDIKLYVGGAYEMDDVLNTAYFTKDVLERDGVALLGQSSSSMYFTHGKLRAYVVGNRYSVDITVAEYGERDLLAYQSLLSFAEVLQPAGYETFIQEYKELTPEKTDAYEVTFPEGDAVTEIFAGKKDTYQFVQLHFEKEPTVLENVYAAFIDKYSDYTAAKEGMKDYITYTEKLTDEGIEISAQAVMDEYKVAEGTWKFVQDGDYLTYTMGEDDFNGLILVEDLLNAVADLYFMDKEMVSGLSTAVNWNKVSDNPYFTMTEESDGTIKVKLYIAGEYENLDKILEDVYIDEEIVQTWTNHKSLPDSQEDSVNARIGAGKVKAVWNGYKDDFTITLAEYGGLSETAYKSLIAIVKVLQPAGYEDFLTDYTKIDTKKEVKTAGYEVSFPIGEDIPDDFKEASVMNDYITVHFTKPEALTTEKPAETENPMASVKPAETQNPMASVIPAETQNPMASVKPAETQNPAATVLPAATAGVSAAPMPEGVAASAAPAAVIKQGDSISLKAGKMKTLTVENGTVAKWTSSKKAVAVVKDGKVTAMKKGKAIITAALSDGTKLTCTVKVTSDPVIKIAGKNLDSKKTYTIRKGKILKAVITGKAAAVNNKYTSSKKKVAKVTSNANAATVKIKGLKKGKAKIGITVNGVKYTVKITVK